MAWSDWMKPVEEQLASLLAGVSELEVTSPVVASLTLTNADAEYSHVVPANTRRVRFRNRTSVATRHAWVTGKVAAPTSPYEMLPADMEYDEDGLLLNGKTLYFACGSAGTVLEIVTWSA